MERTFQGFANLKVGESPGTHVGVYFSEGTPDVRASDSVFRVRIDTDRSWWRSKGGKDAKKGRPRTWHSNGACPSVSLLRAN